jgi:hypothetical protein
LAYLVLVLKRFIQSSRDLFMVGCSIPAMLLCFATMGMMLLAGCANGSPTPFTPDAGGPEAGATIRGGVKGGNQPITGATIQLYAAGAPSMPSSGGSTGGYGLGATALIPAGSMTAGSTNNYFPGGLPSCAISANGTNSNKCTALPQSDAYGNFTLGTSTFSDYVCPSTASQIYIAATGGNPGLGGTVNNQYIALTAGLGTCPANGTLPSGLFININEVTTVATVWALQQFMPAPTGVAASSYASQGGATTGTGVSVGAPSGSAGGYGSSGVQTSIYGLQNAFLMINNLTNISTGSSGTGSTGTATNSWAAPWADKINTIADIIAYCVNSDPTVVNYCSTLMTYATPGSSTTAADTIQAAWYMAQNPVNDVAALYSLVPSTPPFPALSTQPTDWTVVVGLAPKIGSSAAIASAYGGAFDKYGHVWLVNMNSANSAPFVDELGADGSFLAGPFGNSASPYTASGGYSSTCSTTAAHTLTYSGSTGPRAILVDLTNTIWVVNPQENQCATGNGIRTLMRITGSSASGTGAALTNGYFFFGQADALGIDQSDDVFVTAEGGSSNGGFMLEYPNASGTSVSLGGYSIGGSGGGSSSVVVDNNTASGPFIWSLAQKSANCVSTNYGQIFESPANAITQTTPFHTYQSSGCNTATGTGVVVMNAVTNQPTTLAVDRNNNLWATNNGTGTAPNTVTFMAPGSSGVVGPTAATSVDSSAALGGLITPYAVTVDGNNNAWVGNGGTTASVVSELSATYDNANLTYVINTLSGASGFDYPNSSKPFPVQVRGVSIDPSGNVWVFNGSSSSNYGYVSVLVGAAGPVITPVALALKSGMIGLKPGCTSSCSGTSGGKPLSISASSLPGAQQYGAYLTAIPVTGGTPPYIFSLTSGALPPGISLSSSTGVLSGTPTGVGTSNFTVSATDSSTAQQAVSANLSVIVSPTMNVSTSGNRILLNGVNGTLKGFTFVGLLNPTTCAGNFYGNAWTNWSAAELLAAKNTYYANTARIQVNEDLLYDSTGNLDPALTSGYIVSVANAVALVRSVGLAAEVSMQWEQGVTGANICDSQGNTGAVLGGVPGTNTDKAWTNLLTSAAWTGNTSQTAAAVNFNNDAGVMLELFNEPSLGSIAGTTSDWSTWQSNLQLRMNTIRAVGATNVLIVPALNGDQILDTTYIGNSSVASYLLYDPLNTLIYAVHPYPKVKSCCSGINIGEFSPQDWLRWWGDMVPKISAPIMVTEWFTGGASSCWDINNQPTPPVPIGGYAYTDSPTIASQFTAWLATSGPGGSAMSFSGAWPFDSPGYITQDLTTYTPTFFDTHFACGVQVQGTAGYTYEGPGQLIQTYFLNH